MLSVLIESYASRLSEPAPKPWSWDMLNYRPLHPVMGRFYLFNPTSGKVSPFLTYMYSYKEECAPRLSSIVIDFNPIYSIGVQSNNHTQISKSGAPLFPKVSMPNDTPTTQESQVHHVLNSEIMRSRVYPSPR